MAYDLNDNYCSFSSENIILKFPWFNKHIHFRKLIENKKKKLKKCLSLIINL